MMTAGFIGNGNVEFAGPAFVAPYGGLDDELGTSVGAAALRAALGRI